MVTTVERKPKYQSIREALKEEILGGKLSALSETEIIYRFHVSSITARRVLNELKNDGLLERRRGKGSTVIRRPSAPRELGILTFNVVNPEQSTIAGIVDSIEEESLKYNIQLHIYTTRGVPLTQNPDSSVSHLILTRKIGGICVLSPLPVSDLLFLQKERIPFVVGINRYPRLRVSTVIFDIEYAVRETAERLWRSGRRKISLIAHPTQDDYVQRTGTFMLNGYRDFLREHSLPCTEQMIKVRPVRDDIPYEDVELSLIKEFHALPEEARPEVIFGFSWEMRAKALDYLHRQTDWKPVLVPLTYEEIEHPSYVLLPTHEFGKTMYDLLERTSATGEPECRTITPRVCYKEAI